jgi:hypothetical protein
MPMANGMLVTSPFRLQWVEYKRDSKVWKKQQKKKKLGSSPKYFGASFI